MGELAVTEGDKVAAQMEFGFSVNGYGVGDLARNVQAATEPQISALLAEYETRYSQAPGLRKAGVQRNGLREAAPSRLACARF